MEMDQAFLMAVFMRIKPGFVATNRVVGFFSCIFVKNTYDYGQNSGNRRRKQH